MKKIICLSLLFILIMGVNIVAAAPPSEPIYAPDIKKDAGIVFEKTKYRESLYCGKKFPTQEQIENALYRACNYTGTKKMELIDMEKINDNTWTLYFTRHLDNGCIQSWRYFLKRLKHQYWAVMERYMYSMDGHSVTKVEFIHKHADKE